MITIGLRERCRGGKLSLRGRKNNPNHHLWWNRGTWWMHATFHYPDNTKKRVRLGLGTKNGSEARAIRDHLITSWQGKGGA